MRIAIAYAERDGTAWPDDGYAVAIEGRLVDAGHSVERIVVPLSSRRSPQEQALVCQTMPTDAYGDELWTLNFPACLLPHRVRRIWFTRAEPFGSDARAPAGALAALFADAPTSVTVACDALRRRLGLPEDAVEIGLPPAPLRDPASLSIARNGGGLLLVPGALSSDATHGAREPPWRGELRQAGVTSMTEVIASNEDSASQRDALAAASAVFIREDAIARLFDHALLAVRMGTPVLLLGEDEQPVVWRPKGSAPDTPSSRPVPFDEIAHVQSQWLDEEIARACARLDTETQATP